MIDPAMDWGGLKDSENAPNSFFPKINRTLFWRFGTDMDIPFLKIAMHLMNYLGVTSPLRRSFKNKMDWRSLSLKIIGKAI